MTDQTPKPLEDILAAVRSTLLPSPDDALVRALIETIEARIEQDRQEIAALRERAERVFELEAKLSRVSDELVQRGYRAPTI